MLIFAHGGVVNQRHPHLPLPSTGGERIDDPTYKATVIIARANRVYNSVTEDPVLRILMANDDGIHSHGIGARAQLPAHREDAWIVALHVE
jgi:hypothetical protein